MSRVPARKGSAGNSFRMQLERTVEPGETDWIERAPRKTACVKRACVPNSAARCQRGRRCWRAREGKGESEDARLPTHSEAARLHWAS